MSSATLNKKPFFNDYPGFKEASSRQILYVRHNSVTLSLASESYLQQNVVHNLNEATSYLKKMQLSELPELIILDLPFNLKELTFFKNWVTQNLIPPIPIIYKECFLTPLEIKKIFELNLVNDVIKCDQNTTLLYEKIRFFSH